MRIGEMARSVGVTVHTVRFYERKGLLPRAPRGPSNYRDFPPQWLERLRFIRDAQRLGLTLADVRELVGGRKTTMGCAELRHKGEQTLRGVESELRRLRQVRARLRTLLRDCEKAAQVAPCVVSAAVVRIRET
jgi:MerR family mercuric resistance operon transcriptional regulator